MTLREILNGQSWDDIWSALLDAYQDQEVSQEGYRATVEALLVLEPRPSEWIIYVDWVEDYFDKTPYVSVSAKQPGDEAAYSLILTDWAEWIGMRVDKSSLEEFGQLGVLVHCLYEMTFVGYSRSAIQSASDRINEVSKEALETLAEETVKEQG